jgi:hypothetical protein
MSVKDFFGILLIVLGGMMMASSGGCALTMSLDHILHGLNGELVGMVMNVLFTLVISAVPFLIGLAIFKKGLKLAAAMTSRGNDALQETRERNAHDLAGGASQPSPIEEPKQKE